MKTIRIPLGSLGLLVLFGSVLVSSAAAGGVEDYAKLGEAWEAAYNSGDAAAVASFYTDDGMRLPPNMEASNGREAIQGQVETGMALGVSKVDIETIEYEVEGSLGFARGTYVLMDAEGNNLDQGKWVEVARLVDGKWYTYCDIWNSDVPQEKTASEEK